MEYAKKKEQEAKGRAIHTKEDRKRRYILQGQAEKHAKKGKYD